MKGNRRTDTRPEVTLRSALHRQGYRFRKAYLIETSELRVRADVVFPRWKVAVFVDGCFWHCCPTHGTRPTANQEYWLPKLQRNQARDLRVNCALERAGWVVVRIWEHVIPAEAVYLIASTLQQVRQAGQSLVEGLANLTTSPTAKPSSRFSPGDELPIRV
ncbi:MAG: very short patch repair endonuclease [Dehalococcoidia bacterium]|nr:very short patch repair endonuclease [Dehalococcoidia bacterium]